MDFPGFFVSFFLFFTPLPFILQFKQRCRKPPRFISIFTRMTGDARKLKNTRGRHNDGIRIDSDYRLI